MKLTTAISQATGRGIPQTQIAWARQTLVALLAPFAPHLAEHLWQILGQTGSIHHAPWPTFDPSQTRQETIRVAVQVNGKMRRCISVPRTLTQEEITRTARAKVQKYLKGKALCRVVYIPHRLINFVTT